jgi:hypothetical protein
MLKFTSTLFGVVLLLALEPAYGQDFQKGLDAYNNGDYATALREWRPLAEQGDTKGRNSIGWLYFNGEGVAQDYAKAKLWFRLAAEQGDTRAQSNLGYMYGTGQGVPIDQVLAYMWFILAAAQGHKDALAGGVGTAREMTSTQIAKAQRLASEWQEAHQ